MTVLSHSEKLSQKEAKTQNAVWYCQYLWKSSSKNGLFIYQLYL